MTPELLNTVLEELRLDRADADAWERLYRLLWPWLLGTAYRELRTWNVADAEDLSQDVFLTIIEQADFDFAGSRPVVFLGYAKSICRNRALDRLRRGETRKMVEHKLDDVESPPAIDPIVKLGLDEALTQLTPGESKLYGLLALGHSSSEIAEKLTISKGTTYNIVSRLRHLLKSLVGRT